jgi:hypothetical protein
MLFMAGLTNFKNLQTLSSILASTVVVRPQIPELFSYLAIVAPEGLRENVADYMDFTESEVRLFPISKARLQSSGNTSFLR